MPEQRELKIYIVDDDPDIVGIMAAALEAAGHKVGSNLAGSLAIPEIVRRRPDCILIDLVMAELNGFEFLQELHRRRELSNCVFIMVTAKTDDYWARRAAEAGMHGFIRKPLDVANFARQVEAIVEENRPSV